MLNLIIKFFFIYMIFILTNCGGGSNFTSDNIESTSTIVKNNTNDNNVENVDTPKSFGAIETSNKILRKIPIAYMPSGSYLPSSVDLSSNMPSVGNQGVQNSCVGWAVGYYLKSYHEHIENNNIYGVNANYTNRYSPSFIYNIIKIDNCSSGSNIIEALKLVKNTGAVLWDEMPYNQNECNIIPSVKALEDAKCSKILDFKTLYIDTSYFTMNMKYYLSQKTPIIVAIKPYKSFMEPSKYDGEYFYKVFDKNEQYNMLHSILVVGYDDNKKAFKIINSWGKKWGNSGYLWIDYEVFEKIVLESYIAIDEFNNCQIDNEPPISNAGDDIVSNYGIPIFLDGSKSHSKDGKIVKYEWMDYQGNLLSNDFIFSKYDFAIGTHTITLTVTDNFGQQSSDEIVITINKSQNSSFVAIAFDDKTAKNEFLSINYMGKIEVLNSFRFDSIYWNASTFTVSSKYAYLLSDTLLYKFDISTGQILSTVTIDSDKILQSFKAISDKYLIAISYNNKTEKNELLSINSDTGKVKVLNQFKFNSDSWSMGTFIVSDNYAYVISNTLLYKFDNTTGQILSTTSIDINKSLQAFKAVSDEYLIAMSYNEETTNNELLSIESNTGKTTVLNSLKFDSRGWYANTFTVSENYVYALSSNNKIYQFDINTGQIISKTPIDNHSIQSMEGLK